MTTYNTGTDNGRYKHGLQTPGADAKRISPWIPGELYRAMKAQAEAQNTTVSDYVIAAIEAALREESVR